MRLLKATIKAQDWQVSPVHLILPKAENVTQLGKELLRFLFSLDHSGLILRSALEEAGALPPEFRDALPLARPTPVSRSISAPQQYAEADDDDVVPYKPDLQRSATVSSAQTMNGNGSLGFGFSNLISRAGLDSGATSPFRPSSK